MKPAITAIDPNAVWGGAILGARETQQDAFASETLDGDSALLAIVADGMGGHTEGALASKTALAAFQNAFLTARSHGCALEPAFSESLDAANRAIAEAQQGHPEREGMGTTLLAVHISPQGVTWISVGDSPLLLFSNQTIRRLNQDHSLRGLPNYRGAQGNMLQSAVVGDVIPLVDHQTKPVELLSDDMLILASDGILTLSSEELTSLLGANAGRPASGVGAALLSAVDQKKHPSQDNCTVVVATPPVGPPIKPTRIRGPTPSLLVIYVVVAVFLAAMLFLGR